VGSRALVEAVAEPQREVITDQNPRSRPCPQGVAIPGAKVADDVRLDGEVVGAVADAPPAVSGRTRGRRWRGCARRPPGRAPIAGRKVAPTSKLNSRTICRSPSPADAALDPSGPAPSSFNPG
jgi:hypothetical protein